LTLFGEASAKMIQVYFKIIFAEEDSKESQNVQNKEDTNTISDY